MEENKITNPTSSSKMSTHQTTYIILNGWVYGKSYGHMSYLDVLGMLVTLWEQTWGACATGETQSARIRWGWTNYEEEYTFLVVDEFRYNSPNVFNTPNA